MRSYYEEERQDEFYDEVEQLLEDDEINSAEQGFIAGYMGVEA